MWWRATTCSQGLSRQAGRKGCRRSHEQAATALNCYNGYGMTVATNSHIVIDEKGRALIAGTRLKVLVIVAHHLTGMSAEEIQKGYPELWMSQIYSERAYYHDQKSDFDAQ